MAKDSTELDKILYRTMAGLKDFQQATVNRIDYLFRNGQKRVLVADEVGLGKTLIARGSIAKIAKQRKEEGAKVLKVVYVCSNSAIADQNLQKLRITDDVKTTKVSYSRLSMQHLNIFTHEYEKKRLEEYIQLIPLTPETSFRMTSGCGTVEERALMYAVLCNLPELGFYLSELEVAMKDLAPASWQSWCKIQYEQAVSEVNKISNGKYLEFMNEKLVKELSANWKDNLTYMDGLKKLCLSIRNNDGKRSSDNSIIGQLRVIFAKISLERLNPDLVIMDEFQRFRYLLSSETDTEMGMLANKFFQSEQIRMLLLSATPFKMYSTPEEIDELHIDEHYTEFLSVMVFLFNDKAKNEQFKTIWKDYSVKLKEMTLGDVTILSAKKAAESSMYSVVCRTERISSEGNADFIDDRSVHEPLTVLDQDIRSYIQIQKLFDAIGLKYRVPVDYVKSTPYIMSFMRDYKLKRLVENHFSNHPNEIRKLNKDSFWLRRNKIDGYERIPNNNAKLDYLLNTVVQKGMELLLWIPPSKPYYEMQGVFRDLSLLSKTLVFSSWEMVPRMIASLVSYESERRTVGKLAKDFKEEAHYFCSNEKRYPSARLNFSVRNGVPSGMTLFCLIYPSRFLAHIFDPIACMNASLGINDIQKKLKQCIYSSLEKYPVPEFGNADKRWYYVAPMLLDHEQYVRKWLSSKKELADYDDDEKTRKQKGFVSHMDALIALYEETMQKHASNLGKRPDDLLDVLADMAIASPSICVLRTYKKYLHKGESMPVFLPSQLSRLFINRMNSQESTAVVELACGRKTDDAHWQNLLRYCRHGNLQAVFDEYAHLLSCGIDDDSSLVSRIHSQMMKAIDIRTTIYNVDTYNSFKNRITGQKNRMLNIRTHYAIAFTKGDGKESDADRKKTIRNAFNSPFRPFVLATTSIGQEGLDFHCYCRTIVHWNLPSNPIDLEQREGRINRFECLAIRQNVAKRYGNISFQHDVWRELFNEASIQEKTEYSSDLIPFWSLKETSDMIKIKRIVPMYPYSRDEIACTGPQYGTIKSPR